MDILNSLIPWEFSPTLVAMFAVSAVLFARGCRRHRVRRARQLFFWTGFVLLYLSLHTRLDYYAERMFFVHRIQHLVLHHIGPLLIAGAYPGSIMRAGLPLAWRVRLRRFVRGRAGRGLTAVLTQKFLIPTLFVLAVLLWLIPTVQFYAMLDWRLYRLMNWSVVLTGILYWNLVLDRRPSPPAAMTPGGRVISPLLTMVPQMVAGAVIAFTEHDLYPIFDLCGRAIPMPAVMDQSIGGLIMWVPAALIELIGLLIALGTLMRLSGRGRLRSRAASKADAKATAARAILTPPAVSG